ncbi:PAS domain-containing protein [Legionella sp. km772]|uniref:PAS domain-containing protein n=1 Tax=Legionella sp. km772 TaxID=2498111 RepID=UPI000F8C6A64|nr:PAS domain-containing protein [Legionella sp. km772]RUR05153.1 PAS domain-containing protein [Legionella sp. km772]
MHEIIKDEKLNSAAHEHTVNALNKVQAVIEFNLDGTIITANDNFLHNTGYNLEELIGKHHSIFCDKAYVNSEGYNEFWKKINAGNFVSGEIKRFKKDGTEIWFNASYVPVFDKQNTLYKAIKFATNITESKLKNSEYECKLKAINRSQAIIEFTPEGTVLSANENFLNALDYALEDIKGKHHRMFCEPSLASSPEYSAMWERLRNGVLEAGRFKRVGRNGKLVWIEAQYNPIFDSNGKVLKVVKLAINITNQVALEEEIRQTTERFVKKSGWFKSTEHFHQIL